MNIENIFNETMIEVEFSTFWELVAYFKEENGKILDNIKDSISLSYK